MAKRKTKAQIEQDKYARLWQRVHDVVSGACGRLFDESLESDADDMIGLEEAARVIGALQDTFKGPREETEGGKIFHPYDHLFLIRNLDHFCDVRSITDFLFDAGVRA